MIGLDLTSTDTDMLNLAPALVVKRLDPPEDTQDPADPQASPPSFYLCLLSDNRSATDRQQPWHVLQHRSLYVNSVQGLLGHPFEQA